jgi:uncharacterized protein (TIGR02391 family)
LLTQALLPEFGLHPDLLHAVRAPLDAERYADAVVSSFKYLTEVIREKSGLDGDGDALVNLAFATDGERGPRVRINSLRSKTDRNEHEGVVLMLRGMYRAFRNPRAHEMIDESEDSCLRILLMVDTVTRYLRLENRQFDTDAFVKRIYNPRLLGTADHAYALVESVPKHRLTWVFRAALREHRSGDPLKVKHVFHALYARMSGEQLRSCALELNRELDRENFPPSLDGLFQLIRPDLWRLLDTHVRTRLEYRIIELCAKGAFDPDRGETQEKLGTWGAVFGPDFMNRAGLVETIASLLQKNWRAQNYVGRYYLEALPRLTDATEHITLLANSLTYALFINKPPYLQRQFELLCPHYPEAWKCTILSAFKPLNGEDLSYSGRIMPLLSSSTG